jgi:hypothetical protein
LSLIRSFLIDSGGSRASRAAFCAKYFCVGFALHKIAIGAKITAALRENVLSATFATNYDTYKKPLFHRAFCNMRAKHSLRCRVRIESSVQLIQSVVERALHALRASHIHSVKWSQCFFHCAGVNQMQCASIPDRTDATPAMLHG